MIYIIKLQYLRTFFLFTVPPESVIILDSKGATIKDHTLGPYNEGSGINITCVAIGGKSLPHPLVLPRPFFHKYPCVYV